LLKVVWQIVRCIFFRPEDFLNGLIQVVLVVRRDMTLWDLGGGFFGRVSVVLSTWRGRG
jgi:hypothetical protein